MGEPDNWQGEQRALPLPNVRGHRARNARRVEAQAISTVQLEALSRLTNAIQRTERQLAVAKQAHDLYTLAQTYNTLTTAADRLRGMQASQEETE